MFTLTELTHVNADYTKVVAEDDPRVAFVLGPKGHKISDELAMKLGLMKKPRKTTRRKKTKETEL